MRTPRRLFLLWLSPAPPARAPACAPPNPPARGRGGRRRAVRRGGRGRRSPRGAWAAGLGLRAGCGGAALTCGRRRRAGQRAPGARAARGRADGGARGRAAPLPSSEEAPAVRRGPGRARLTSSILSGAGGGRRAGRGAASERPPQSARGKPLRSPAGFPHRDPGGHGVRRRPQRRSPPGLGPLPSGRAVSAARLVGSRRSPAFPAPLFRSAAKSAGELRTRLWRQ